MALHAQHGQVVGARLVKRPHDALHGVGSGKRGRRQGHELAYREAMVELGTKDDVAHLRQVDLSQEVVVVVGHGQVVVAIATDGEHQFAHLHIGPHGGIVALDDAVHAHQGQDRVVRMVGEQFALAGQSERIDAMAHEDGDREVGTHGHDDERDEEAIATRQFGDEEDARQGGVHDSRHHTRHAIEREVLLGHIDAELILIPKAREEEAKGSADEERGGKGTTTTTRAIGGTRGEDLRDDHQGHIEDEILALAREERLLHDGIPVGLGLALDEDGQGVVALAIERRKEEDERAQGETSHEELDVGSLGQSRIAVLTPRHRAHKVDGDEATAHTQEDGGWQTVELEDVVGMEIEHRGLAREEVGEAGGRDRGDEDGQERGHGQIDHQDLDREDQSRYRGLENACHGCRGATAHEEHQPLALQMEELAEVGANGRSRQDDRGLGSHGSTKADSDGRSHDRRPGVVGLEVALLRRDGIEHARDAVGDVVSHDIFDEEGGQPHAYDRIDQVEPVDARDAEARGDQQFDLMDDEVEHPG